MANVIPYAFRGELFTGTHNFASGGDSFKIALYTANPYNTSSTVYSATSEVSASGTNYTTTGNALTVQGNLTVRGSVTISDALVSQGDILFDGLIFIILIVD